MTSYLERAGLPLNLAPSLATWAEHLRAVAVNATLPTETETLYRYRVPELGEHGACSLPDQLAAEPYDLRATLGGEQPETTHRLAVLNALVAALATETGCGWIGIYQARQVLEGRALVKLAYRGKPSRPEFPLTPEFAGLSNNSTVGLSGRAKVIARVDDYVAAGGAYYTCDAEVQSEACLPMFDAAGTVIGIVDAEDARPGYFSGDTLAAVAALCVVAPEYLPG
jgi:putative methionine-R-sulfoxide reductase with GAF domain